MHQLPRAQSDAFMHVLMPPAARTRRPQASCCPAPRPTPGRPATARADRDAGCRQGSFSPRAPALLLPSCSSPAAGSPAPSPSPVPLRMAPAALAVQRPLAPCARPPAVPCGGLQLPAPSAHPRPPSPDRRPRSPSPSGRSSSRRHSSGVGAAPTPAQHCRSRRLAEEALGAALRPLPRRPRPGRAGRGRLCSPACVPAAVDPATHCRAPRSAVLSDR
ncbi:hypothetical protein PVAP13_5KG764650 [Panicum virgatum]|uniref:Uncharacterized protein n=1 Tax=Panicum virgatum TaxID=38727 RepID=A0A8T0T270_PANVG|nr:hypothetical protein PVAP13_5KG764650 [Panicum virgatum]